MTLYIAHVCLNSKLSKKHLDYCEIGFIDVAPNAHTISEQCWKYCPSCEAKGFQKISNPPARGFEAMENLNRYRQLNIKSDEEINVGKAG